MIQINFPYDTEFGYPLPAWPNAEGCKAAKAFPPNEPTVEREEGSPSIFNTTYIRAI